MSPGERYHLGHPRRRRDHTNALLVALLRRADLLENTRPFPLELR